MDHRQVLRLIAAGRFAAGAAMLALPGTVASRWIGDVGATPAVKVLTRALGAREVGLAVGTLRSLELGEPARPWAVASAAADATDAVTTAVALFAGRLRWDRAAPVLAIAATAATLGALSAQELDDSLG